MFRYLRALPLGDRVKWVLSVVGVFSLIPTIIGLIWPSWRTTAFLGALGIVVVFAGILFENDVRLFLRRPRPGLDRAVPYVLTGGTLLVMFGLFLIGSTLRHQEDLTKHVISLVTDGSPPITISMNSIQSAGGLFNSWSILNAREGYVHAFTSGDQGDTWLIDQISQSAGFSFRTHPGQTRRDLDSSGGYIRFYDRPVSRLVYRYLSFSSRVADPDPNPKATPDLGVRLAIDDPHSPAQDKEIVTYQVTSLSSLGKPLLKQSWQRYEIYVWQLDPVTPRAPIQSGVDRNLINKIVFFISNDVADHFSKGTLWFRDIQLSAEMQGLR
jgi:hypothetical protein